MVWTKDTYYFAADAHHDRHRILGATEPRTPSGATSTTSPSTPFPSRQPWLSSVSARWAWPPRAAVATAPSDANRPIRIERSHEGRAMARPSSFVYRDRGDLPRGANRALQPARQRSVHASELAGDPLGPLQVLSLDQHEAEHQVPARDRVVLLDRASEGLLGLIPLFRTGMGDARVVERAGAAGLQLDRAGQRLAGTLRRRRRPASSRRPGTTCGRRSGGRSPASCPAREPARRLRPPPPGHPGRGARTPSRRAPPVARPPSLRSSRGCRWPQGHRRRIRHRRPHSRVRPPAFRLHGRGRRVHLRHGQ